MAIDTNLLVCAPILQDYFVDNETGEAMVAGVITCYHDNARTTLKNWYYQTGSPGAYTYLPLPNPLTLSDVGTIQDNNRNDVIPFWYPYDENDSSTGDPYYVTVVNSGSQNQFTRQNFPFNPGTSSGNEVVTNNNLITNNEFWRNIGSVDASDLSDNEFEINGIPMYFTALAPSQHDGFTMPDITFWKNENDGTDTLTFEKFTDNFPNQVILNEITPEYYLNYQCTSAGTSTTKYLQIPIQLHVDALSGVPNSSAVISAMAVAGSPTITIQLFQYLGSGVTSPAASTIQTIVLGQSWHKYTSIPFTFPSAQTVTTGNGNDDAFYLQIGYAAGTTFEINIAKPGVYLSDTVPTNDWQTYDQINSVISSPRTADVKLSLSNYEFGYVPMNDGTIGDPTSAATCRANKDTWPLYYLLWNKFKPYSNGTTNVLAPMVNNMGTAVAYGSSAIGDFNAHNGLALTQTMGKVILGTVPLESLLANYSTTWTPTNSGGTLAVVCANTVNAFNGMPIVFTVASGGTLPDGINATTVYYVQNFNGTTSFDINTSFANVMAGTTPIAYPVNPFSGTQTVTLALTGTFEGEYAHRQLTAELATHNHSFGTHQSSAGAGVASDTFISGNTINNVYSAAGFPIFNTGSSTPFNVTQPGSFFNFFMKL